MDSTIDTTKRGPPRDHDLNSMDTISDADLLLGTAGDLEVSAVIQADSDEAATDPDSDGSDEE